MQTASVVFPRLVAVSHEVVGCLDDESLLLMLLLLLLLRLRLLLQVLMQRQRDVVVPAQRACAFALGGVATHSDASVAHFNVICNDKTRVSEKMVAVVC